MCLNLAVSREIQPKQILFYPAFKISDRSFKEISAGSLRELQLSDGSSSEAERHQPPRWVVLRVLITPWLIKMQPHGIWKSTCKLSGTDVLQWIRNSTEELLKAHQHLGIHQAAMPAALCCGCPRTAQLTLLMSLKGNTSPCFFFFFSTLPFYSHTSAASVASTALVTRRETRLAVWEAEN